jgi:heme exporter protein A
VCLNLRQTPSCRTSEHWHENGFQRLLLQADNLTVERGARAVVAGLSFKAEAGKALLVVGPNGAGKTTLIRTIAGFIRPTAGTLALKGDSGDRDLGEHCHYVGHLTGVKASLTAAQNLAFWASFLGDDHHGQGRTDRVEAALDKFGLGALADFPAGLLSAGQKRRLGLARLLVAKRPIWLLDEPTASLDATSSELLAGLIQAHLSDGGLMIAATHLPLGVEDPSYLRLGTPSFAAEAPRGAAP